MSECGFVSPQRRQVAAYGRPGLHPMRIARIDGFGCGFGDQGVQYVEGQFGSVQNLASQCVEVIDEIAGENRRQVKAYATVGVGSIYRAAQIAGERFELRGESVVVSFDEKRYLGKIHAAALGKGLQGIENAPTVEGRAGRASIPMPPAVCTTAASAGMGRLSASVVIAASLTARR